MLSLRWYNFVFPTFILMTPSEVHQTFICSVRAFLGKKWAYCIPSWIQPRDGFLRLDLVRRKRQKKTRRRNAPHQMELVHENARSVLRNASENLFYRAVKTKVYIPRQIGKLCGATTKGITRLHHYTCAYYTRVEYKNEIYRWELAREFRILCWIIINKLTKNVKKLFIRAYTYLSRIIL